MTYATTVVDTVLSAYTGTTRLTCNDDAGDPNSAEITLPACDAGERT